jgi:putative N6-adenine-specific DNA methylase
MRFFATCAKGTEGALRRELAALRLPAVSGGRGGVFFEGRLEHGMRACLWSRTAVRVLLQLSHFPAPDAGALYDGVRGVDWTEWFTARTTLAVEATVSSSALTHSHYAALKVKDAVVDALRQRLGARPDVSPTDPDVRIVMHLSGDEADLSLDLAGQPLHRRGYRAAMTPAPLKETLAAAVLSLGRVPAELPFVDPMCGSGTLAIEQALSARQVAPGLGRAFGFQRWPAYRGAHQSAWDRMKERARAGALPRAPAPIVARDLFTRALEAARRNAAAAGVAEDVTFEQGDARKIEPRWPEGTVCLNPPYGERLGGRRDREPVGRPGRQAPGRAPGEVRRGQEPGRERPPHGREGGGRLQLTGLYRGLGEMLRRFHGWRAVILCGNPMLDRELGLKPEVSHRLWNGPIEARLLRYRIP